MADFRFYALSHDNSLFIGGSKCWAKSVARCPVFLMISTTNCFCKFSLIEFKKILYLLTYLSDDLNFLLHGQVSTARV